MSSTKKPAKAAGVPLAKKAAARPHPTPMVHGGRPAGGGHVLSAVPGEGAYDASGAIGSNIRPAPGPRRASDNDVLSAPPFLGPSAVGMVNGSPVC